MPLLLNTEIHCINFRPSGEISGSRDFHGNISVAQGIKSNSNKSCPHVWLASNNTAVQMTSILSSGFTLWEIVFIDKFTDGRRWVIRHYYGPSRSPYSRYSLPFERSLDKSLNRTTIHMLTYVQRCYGTPVNQKNKVTCFGWDHNLDCYHVISVRHRVVHPYKKNMSLNLCIRSDYS